MASIKKLNQYEELLSSLFEVIRKNQARYYSEKNGRKVDVIRNIISKLDLDDEYWRWLKRRKNYHKKQGGTYGTKNKNSFTHIPQESRE